MTKRELRAIILEELATCLREEPPAKPTPPMASADEVDSQIGVEVVSRVGNRLNRKLSTNISKSRKNVTSVEGLVEAIWRAVSDGRG